MAFPGHQHSAQIVLWSSLPPAKTAPCAGQELHTNFKLSADGEYLALFGPDGSVATEISPQFPPQFPDVSYGIGMQLTTTTLMATNAAIHYLIPTNVVR